MTFRILRPNQESIYNGGWGAVGSSGSLANSQDDGSASVDSSGQTDFTGNRDSTYNRNITNSDYYIVGFNSYTLADDERCKRWRACMRAGWAYTGQPHDVDLGIGNYTDSHFTNDDDIAVGSKGNFNGTFRETYQSNEIEQAQINKVQVRIRSTQETGGFGPFGAIIYETSVVLDIRKRAAIQSMSVSGGYTPVVSWVANIYNSQAQTKYHFKIFNLAVNPSPTFGSSTGLEYNSGETTSAATSKNTLTTLTNGSYRILAKVVKDFNGTDWESSVFTKNFTLAGTPGTPTGVGPTSAQNTDLPILTATIARAAVSNAPQVKARWQVASDNLFTTNLVSLEEADSNFNNGGVHTEPIPLVDALFTGTWYVRARATDENGVEGSWSSTVSFVVSHPPTAIGTAPDGGGAIVYDAGGTTVEWVFADTSPVDEQTAFQAILELADTATLILDSGKVTSAAQLYEFVVSSGDTDVLLRWAVRLWDRDDVVGPYSDYATFLLADIPDVTITAPTGTIDSPQPTVTWTFTASGGRVQTAYRVQFTLDSTSGVIHDSGWLSGDTDTYTPPISILLNSENYTVTVSVRDSMGLTNTDDSSLATSWSEPAGADFTVDTSNFNSEGFNLIEWTNANVDAEFFAWRVYRQHDILPNNAIGFIGAALTGADETNWELIDEELTDQPTYSFSDYGGYSDEQYYAVVQVALRSGAEVETDRYDIAVASDPNGEHYWLIIGREVVNNLTTLIDYDFAYKLEHVTADQMTDEYEQEELHLLNRGRRVEYGTYLGRNGSATCRLRDSESGTARDKRLSVEWIKRLAIEFNYDLYLRTPFGDRYKIDASAISFERDAGLGDREHGTLTFPYLQVY